MIQIHDAIYDYNVLNQYDFQLPGTYIYPHWLIDALRDYSQREVSRNHWGQKACW